MSWCGTDDSPDWDVKWGNSEIEYLKSENEELKQLIQQANNYLSGHGCGGSSVQRAAELWRKMHEETNRRSNS